jgi:predicted alpha-1,6-mannanase (GH76 family)
MNGDRAMPGEKAHPAPADRADLAQHGLTRHFGGLVHGSLRSSAPPRLSDLGTFNYWWLAHAVEVRLDAYERSGCPGWLHLAEKTYTGIRRRNRGSLFNDYFDDMSWLAIAAVRLFDATHKARYLADAEALWRHIVSRGFSTDHIAAIGWRRQQRHYANAPTNGAFGIVSARLFERTGSKAQLAFAESSLAFLDTVLRDPESGFLADGLNRTGDGTLDADWRFSYNQGLYLGVQLEAFARTSDRCHLEAALRTALSTIALLAPAGVITAENVNRPARGGADIGLFKGIFYRYASDLARHPAARADPASADHARSLESFVIDSTDQLWQTFEPSLLAADDWRLFPTGSAALSTELSAVMALEARARLEQARATPH